MTTGIGEALRAARRQQGRSLGDAAAATRVRESYLAALEEEEFGALGGDVYVKGFLRSYAKYLNVDPEPLLDTYRREFERSEDGMPVSRHTPPPLPPEGRDGLPPVAIAGALAFVGLALFLLFSRGGEDEPEVPAPPPVEETTAPLAETTLDPSPEGTAGPDVTATPTATGTPTEPVDPNAPAAPAEERSETVTVQGERLRVRIVVDEPGSEVRVTSDDSLRAERDMAAGTDLTFEAEESIEFRISNAAAVRLVANGEPQGELGGPDEVVTIRFVLAS